MAIPSSRHPPPVLPLLRLHLLLSTFLPALQATSPPTYDYIIVGAGTAGSTLATRLCTRLPDATILLLDAGAPRTPQEDPTVLSARLALATWSLPNVVTITPSDPIPSLANRTLPILIPHTLGGSTAVNVGQVTRPVAGTYASWGVRGLTEGRGKLLFKRFARKWGAFYPRRELQHRYARAVIAAGRRAGFEYSSTPFDGGDGDAWWINRLIFDRAGRRRDAFTAYVRPVLNAVCKRNLHLVTAATVEKVILSRIDSEACMHRDMDGKLHKRKAYPGDARLCARGVRYVRNGRVRFAYARRGTILSAGAYHTPTILQRSGVGLPSTLRKAGIATRLKLPVGERAQSRLTTLQTFAYGLPLARENNATVVYSASARRLFAEGKGGVLGVGFTGLNGRLGRDAYLTMSNILPPGLGEGERLILLTCIVNPDVRSRGYVRVRTRDVKTAPAIGVNGLDSRVDVRRAVRCAQRMRGVMREMEGPLRGREVVDGFENTAVLDDDAVMENYLRASMGFSYHFVGSAAVGWVTDGGLRVRKVGGLRVVDASAIPDITTSSGLMASTFVLAEHAADMIVREHTEGAKV